MCFPVPSTPKAKVFITNYSSKVPLCESSGFVSFLAETSADSRTEEQFDPVGTRWCKPSMVQRSQVQKICGSLLLGGENCSKYMPSVHFSKSHFESPKFMTTKSTFTFTAEYRRVPSLKGQASSLRSKCNKCSKVLSCMFACRHSCLHITKHHFF